MKKILSVLSVFLMLVGVSTATTTTLVPDSVEMEPMETVQGEFCMFDGDDPVVVDVNVDPICKDEDGQIGCQPGDVSNPVGFEVLLDDDETDSETGCVGVTINTYENVEYGKYYYTVNGGYYDDILDVSETKVVLAELEIVGGETGGVTVPEFGTIGAAIALVGASVVLFKKRK